MPLCGIGNVDEALSVFNWLMVREPKYAELWSSIAKVLAEMGNEDSAKSIHERAEWMRRRPT